MNTKIIESMKRLYEAGVKTKDEFVIRVENGEKNSLTKKEYKEITGEDYAE